MPNTRPDDTPVQHARPPRVLIMSVVRFLREGMAHALESEGITEILLASAQTPLAHLRSPIPDLAVVDVCDHRMVERMRQLTTGVPPLRVIAFGVDESEDEILACADAGASGYLARDCSVQDLVAAIERVRRGELLCSTRVAVVLLREHAAHTQSASSDMVTSLTHRERDVLRHVQRGLGTKEIAALLHISLTTVSHHVHALLHKVHASRRAAASAAMRGFLDGRPDAR